MYPRGVEKATTIESSATEDLESLLGSELAESERSDMARAAAEASGSELGQQAPPVESCSTLHRAAAGSTTERIFGNPKASSRLNGNDHMPQQGNAAGAASTTAQAGRRQRPASLDSLRPATMRRSISDQATGRKLPNVAAPGVEVVGRTKSTGIVPGCSSIASGGGVASVAQSLENLAQLGDSSTPDKEIAQRFKILKRQGYKFTEY